MSAQPLDAVYWESVDDGAGGYNYRLRETPLALNYPVETRVIDGVSYGHSEDPKEGNFVYPIESTVVNGITYGANGTEYTGTYAGVIPDYPSEDDVIDGVVFGDDAYTGNFVVPTEAQVEENVQYGANGTEYTGTFQGGGDCDYPAVSDVREDVVYADGTLTGTLVVGGGVIPIVGTLQEKMVGYVHTAHGESATIMRGALTTNVVVIPDDHMIDMLSGVGDAGHVSSIDRVFRVRVAAYLFGGIASTPKAGDRVVWGGQTWEVIRQANYAVPGYRNEFVLPCTRMS